MAEPRLNYETQGVDFDFVVDGLSVAGHISREALERIFGADEQPPSWLAAFQRNADGIRGAAASRYTAGAQEPVFLAHGDF